MAYNNIISRNDAAALIPEDVQREIWKAMPGSSAAVRFFRNVRLSRAQQRIPVMSVLPTAYFVNGDTGLKQTTEADWTNKYINVEELACIVPIPEAVLDDQDYDIWGEVKPAIVEAMGIAIDSAILYGLNKPASWPTDLSAAAVAAGNTVTRGTATQAQGGIAEDVNQVMAKVEDDGYDVNGFIAKRSFKARVRSARDTTGQKLIDVSNTEIEGQPIQFTPNAVWPTPATGAAEMIAGDFSQGVMGIRQDITWKILDQAVIQDGSGAIVYNLPQQDMVALRAVFRLGWQVPNPVNPDQPVEANRYPFAVLRQP